MRFLDTVRLLDWPLFGAIALLVLVGLSMLMSATYVRAALPELFIKQFVATGVGFALALLVAKIPYHSWRRYAPVLYVAGLLGLLIVALTGTVIRGTVSRLEFFGFQVQPSELMKIVLVLALAWLLCTYKIIGTRHVVMSGLIVGIPVLLVLREPDVGTAGLMVLMWVGTLAFLGLSWKHMVGLALVGVVLVAGAWQWALLDYQKERLVVFLHPAKDPLRAGYSITQSIIALGSGRILGRGLGHGPQSQLKFLPERHTDFIFASIGEELGFVGISLVVTLYGVVLWRLVYIARATSDTFGQLICVGVFFVVFGSLAVSAGMNMGLLPVTGIPLPFVSYGGSNLVATLVMIGLVQSVRVYSQFAQAPPPEIKGIV